MADPAEKRPPFKFWAPMHKASFVVIIKAQDAAAAKAAQNQMACFKAPSQAFLMPKPSGPPPKVYLAAHQRTKTTTSKAKEKAVSKTAITNKGGKGKGAD